ncbi:MAG: metallophosphoesterase [Alphaproteobacteria bacterium]|nr:metallophosphoesterase [Alphaproteobacteria bacterium]
MGEHTRHIAGLDFVSDVGGNADALERLLAKMGYVKFEEIYRHPEGRILVQPGDLFDGLHQNVRVYDILRPMVEEGHARVINGNHEVLHICFARGIFEEGPVCNPPFMRKVLRTTLDEIVAGSSLHREMTGWLQTLPLMITFKDAGVRTAHACYDELAERILLPYRDEGGALSEAVYDKFSRRIMTPSFEGSLGEELVASAVNRVVNGPEIKLPSEYFLDFGKGEGVRHFVRPYYWRDVDRMFPFERLFREGREAAIGDDPLERDKFFTALCGQVEGGLHARQERMPTIVGHFSLAQAPHINADKLLCVDYTDRLTAYRVDVDAARDENGHHIFHEDNLVWVPF